MGNFAGKPDVTSTAVNLSVLCVDDDKDILVVTKLALETFGQIDVTCAQDADEALRLLIDPSFYPDCILLDEVMPLVNGKLLLGEIRALPNHRDTPVIFVTARVQDVDKLKYLQLGAKGVILKPFDPLTLAEKVVSLLAS
ncbi:MAG: response regulator [Oxalobacteraceae bacterium]|nr:MAG: response regulator [Oxalobacteraceae bacterium]